MKNQVIEMARGVAVCFILVLLLTISGFGAWYVGKYAAYLATAKIIPPTIAPAVLLVIVLFTNLVLTVKKRTSREIW